MADKSYFFIELVGSSTTSIEDAINGALADAAKKVDGIRWFEVLETRGHVENNQVAHYQVRIKAGYVG